jgi:hypothetical protein
MVVTNMYLDTDDIGVGIRVSKIDTKLWSMRWTFELVNGNIYRIVNMWRSECLTAQDVSPKSTLVQIEGCKPNYWTQQWILEKVFSREALLA